EMPKMIAKQTGADCLLLVGSEVYTTTKQQSITTEPAVCSELDTSNPQFDIFGILAARAGTAGQTGWRTGLSY
ncbi:MAG: hypothetical protein OXC63_00850, partial [Aestuariivita sp.]|nr:hypothetical protein [Aestuariivita sp.]